MYSIKSCDFLCKKYPERRGNINTLGCEAMPATDDLYILALPRKGTNYVTIISVKWKSRKWGYGYHGSWL